MRLKENYFYDCILDYKYNTIKLLYNHSDNTKFTMSIRDLLSLYLIDYENAGANEYDKKLSKNILDLYDKYNSDNDSSIELTVKDIKNIIKVGQKNRISLELNKEIARLFLDLFLNTHGNPYYKITPEQFDDICDNLLVE